MHLFFKNLQDFKSFKFNFNLKNKENEENQRNPKTVLSLVRKDISPVSCVPAAVVHDFPFLGIPAGIFNEL